MSEIVTWTASTLDQRTFFFRGDDFYRDGPVGRELGTEADAADIQDFADHVLKKESRRTSRYTSFTTELKIARKFTSSADDRMVRKVRITALRELEDRGKISIWNEDLIYDSLRRASGKLANLAAAVRMAMRRNREILIEGQIPAGLLEPIG